MLGEEKLEFSVEDFGRLASYSDSKTLLAVIFDFLKLHESDPLKHKELWSRLLAGYNEE